MSKNDVVISVKDFVMKFGSKKVVDGLSFEVKRGEVFGFLGSNGSGKTTTLRALLGVFEPTSGELLVNGQKFEPASVRLGYLPEERGLYKKESVFDVMKYFADLKGVKNAAKWINNYLKRVDLDSMAKSRIETLSGGQQQKIQLGVTIMGEPDILILDEPTKGFDPVNRRLLNDLIEAEHKRGATILMISHDMEEVEKTCDRILLLKNGKAEAYGEISEVKKQFGLRSLDDIFVKVYGGGSNG
ncbi:ATP-binding cassette domain-containing protein [Candidatus Saccharibacteria bacterium]|nr:ATP-binding cassette domain-containing protein [Candidatus Saccharibacteria bacterium]